MRKLSQSSKRFRECDSCFFKRLSILRSKCICNLKTEKSNLGGGDDKKTQLSGLLAILYVAKGHI